MNKQTNCTNCQHEFKTDDQFCPSCGQSRADYNTNFITILIDYINEAFGIDSKLKHTYIPFFTKPQFLSEEFLKGRRQHYVHPVRLYLISSLFFLFIFNNVIIDTHSFKIDFDELYPKKDKQEKSEPEEVSSEKDKNDIVVIDKLTGSDTTYSSEDEFFTEEDTKKYEKIVDFIREAKVVNTQTINDSLGINSWYQVKLIKQARYFYDEKGVTFFQAVVENIPLAIMLLVPLFAVYLKLLYIRNKGNLYIQHLIFSIHLHSITLIVIGLLFLFGNLEWSFIGFLNTFLIFYLCAIVLLMFKKFYRQSWSKTIFKLMIASVLHGIMIFWVIVGELLISLLIF